MGKSSPFEIESPDEEIHLSTIRKDPKNPWRIYERAKRRIQREASSPEEYERRLKDLLEYLQL